MKGQLLQETNSELLSTRESLSIYNEYENRWCNRELAGRRYGDVETNSSDTRNITKDTISLPTVYKNINLENVQPAPTNTNRYELTEGSFFNNQNNKQFCTSHNINVKHSERNDACIFTGKNICNYRSEIVNSSGYSKFKKFCHEPIPTTSKYVGVSARKTRNCSEKMTYVRPIVNCQNEHILHIDIEKNQRLRNITRQLAIAREKERQSIAWKNYINTLKNKYAHDNTKVNHPCPCNRPVYDVYQQCNQPSIENENCIHQTCTVEDRLGPIKLKNNPYYCYPMSSQGCLTKMITERPNQQSTNIHRPLNRHTYEDIIVSREPVTKINNSRLFPKYSRAMETNKLNWLNTVSTQTEKILKQATHDASNVCFICRESEVELKKASQEKKKYEHKKASLSRIESQLTLLIQSMNKLIGEVKANAAFDDNKKRIYVTRISNSISDTIEISKSGIVEVQKSKKEYDDNNLGKSEAYVMVSRSSSDKYKRAISEEVIKSRNVQTYIEGALGEQLKVPYVPCVSDKSTKSGSNEQTDPILTTDNRIESKDKKAISTEISRITTAINTDPLGLLALLSMSTGTIKQLLSYMPNIPYHLYFSILQPAGCRQPPLKRVTHFVCNICGAAFRKPSQLSDHVEGHNLGKAKDCCVCRHYVDSHCRTSRALFACRYCGQRFVRAYCCDLHEQLCAKRLGVPYDVDSSRMLLR